LIKSPNVDYIYFNRRASIQLEQSLPLINLTSLLNTTNFTGAGQTICIVDTGINWSHPDLGGCFGNGCKVLDGFDFHNNDSDPMDDNDHGTYVAGIAAAKGGINGVAPNARLIAMKVCGSTGTNCGLVAISNAITWCTLNKSAYNISIISISLSNNLSYNDLTGCPIELEDEINNASTANISVVFSSGNRGFIDGISWPACRGNVTSVGSVYDEDIGQFNSSVSNGNCTDNETYPDKIACSSNRGSNLDILAPGCRINSTDKGGGYKTDCGTSAAAPIISGVIALLRQKNNTLVPSQIEEILKDSGKSIYDNFTSRDNGGGSNLTFKRVDALAAILSINGSNLVPPNVFLVYPSNNSIIKKNLIEFTYNVSDQGDTLNNCSLWISDNVSTFISTLILNESSNYKAYYDHKFVSGDITPDTPPPSGTLFNSQDRDQASKDDGDDATDNSGSASVNVGEIHYFRWNYTDYNITDNQIDNIFIFWNGRSADSGNTIRLKIYNYSGNNWIQLNSTTQVGSEVSLSYLIFQEQSSFISNLTTDIALTEDGNDLDYDIETDFVYLNISTKKFLSLNQTNLTITQDVNQTFNLTLNNGDYNWMVSCRDITNREGNSSIFNISISGSPNDQYKFNITDGTGSTVAWLGSEGNIVLKGTCTSGGTCTAPANSFIIKDASGDTKAYIDSNGNLCTESATTCANSDQQVSCSSPNDSFIVKDDAGNEVIVIDSTNGNLCSKGGIYESSTP